MNLVIDSFRDMILIYEEGTKKVPDFCYEKRFDYSLCTLENQQKALVEITKEDESLRQTLSKGVKVVIPDTGIGFGTFDLPSLSRFKLRDVFTTRFKSSYPNFEAFHVNDYEYERNESGAMYFYTFCKKDRIQGINSALKAIGSHASSIEYYASHYARSNDPKSLFPHATLFIGERSAELILTKGKKVLYIYEFGYGTDWLNKGDTYVESAYNPNNEKALQFASFATENFAKRVPFSDENIEKSAPDSSFILANPKEVRVMKEDILEAYLVKNKLRKFYSFIADVVAHYAVTPWFLPITNIDVVCEEDIAAALNAVEKGEGKLTFTYLGDEPFGRLVKSSIGQNPLFSSGVKKERRRIDWKKLLTMEIGKKKA